MPIINNYTAIITPYTWGGQSNLTSRPQFVTFSFENVVQTYFTTAEYTQAFLNSFAPFTDAEKNVARAALAQWASASGLIFLEVPGGQGDIRFGSYDFSLDSHSAGYSGLAWYPNTNISDFNSYRDEIGGDVQINIGDANDTYLLLHEIGHALGLEHPFEGDTTLGSGFDNHRYTVMSYTGNYPSQLGVFDLQAIAAVYGAPGSGGTQVASWSWNGATYELSRTGLSTGDTIYGVSVRDIIDGAGGDDRIAGFQGDDALYGGTGYDVLFGNEGADTLDGGTGFDKLIGESGSDTYYIDSAGDIVEEYDLNITTGGNDIVYFVASSGSYFLTSYVERLTLSGSSAISGVGNFLDNTIIGNSSINTLSGQGGADLLFGLAGNDRLEGEEGSDHLYGGIGADEHIGGDDSGIDLARYDDGFYGNLVIWLDNSTANTGVAAGDTYVGIEGLVGGAGNDYVLGGVGNNALFGSGGADLIFGLAGVDYLNGGAGSDNLYGGLGADNHVGGDGTGLDFARYDDGNYGNLTIRLDYSNLNTGAARGDIYSGIEGLVGGVGNDIVIGNGAANYLFGSGGADYIDGQSGSDFLFGGSGNDRFGFTTTVNSLANIDYLSDFTHGTDDIQLLRSIFAAIGTTLDAGELRIGTTATDINDFVVYNNNTGQIFYDNDGSGANAQVLFARVATGVVLDVNDFIMM